MGTSLTGSARYKSMLCEDAFYLQELVRYIHLNPIWAGNIKDLGGIF
jgi:hypothetical protein